MSSVDPPPHIPGWAVQRVRNLHRDLGASQIVRQLHEQALTDTERETLPQNSATRDKILQLWQKRRGVPLEQAVLDLASRAQLLAPDELQNLQEALQIPTSASAVNQDVPEWDRALATLRFRGQVVKKIHRLLQSEKQDIILRVFQEERWPPRIDDPLPNGRDPERLRRVVRSLNNGLTLIWFEADGSGQGVRWHIL